MTNGRAGLWLEPEKDRAVVRREKASRTTLFRILGVDWTLPTPTIPPHWNRFPLGWLGGTERIVKCMEAGRYWSWRVTSTTKATTSSGFFEERRTDSRRLVAACSASIGRLAENESGQERCYETRSASYEEITPHVEW